jgi:hypothetical protein
MMIVTLLSDSKKCKMYLFEGILTSACSDVEAVKKWAKIKVLTIIDFTKTYHSPPKIHGLSVESVDFGWSPHKDSMRTFKRLWRLHRNMWRTVKYRKIVHLAGGSSPGPPMVLSSPYLDLVQSLWCPYEILIIYVDSMRTCGFLWDMSGLWFCKNKVQIFITRLTLEHVAIR